MTGAAPFQKVHMLGHCAEFATAKGQLGRYSEAALESSHFTFNHQLHHYNRNDPREHLRRSLVGVVLPLRWAIAF